MYMTWHDMAKETDREDMRWGRKDAGSSVWLGE